MQIEISFAVRLVDVCYSTIDEYAKQLKNYINILVWYG